MVRDFICFRVADNYIIHVVDFVRLSVDGVVMSYKKSDLIVTYLRDTGK